ncbi:MAG: 16S rRNA (adenine(1518)-N(6)/adenine(1519)-N(6))-dimethyltransferase RsmA [Gammaproteobacteria bacterium]|nr:16S rRNA (adenine(1518)-N(6)/adenine(1519)-N(6))-dimethyltransferase RsmA [Gammaproteobacteria bacterium]
MSHRPRKRFGQNFLEDSSVIEHIVAAIDPRPGQNLIEIGPGKGALTLPVLARCQAMTAIELDRDLVTLLRNKTAATGRLELLSQDVLKTDFAAFGAGQRIIGNLPYNISTPVLFHLLSYRPLLRDMHFMLQNEVVERMASHPGSKTYGRLSVMLQTYCSVSKLLDVPPAAFDPPPKVDSAVVRLEPKPATDIPAHDPQRLSAVVTLAFAQRRKTLRNNLRGVIGEKQIESLDIDAGTRAENLRIDQFVALSALLPEKP